MSTTVMDDLIAFYGEPIHTYTRAQAIADGTLVQPDEQLVREAGINFPLAMTAAAHADLVAWDAATEKRKGGTGNSETGRLWDVLNMTYYAIRARVRAGESTFTDGTRIPVTLYRIPAQGRGTMARRTTVHAVLGGDDNGGPCITVMLTTED